MTEKELINELESLRAWKAEATLVLGWWDEVADLFENILIGAQRPLIVKQRVEALIAAGHAVVDAYDTAIGVSPAEEKSLLATSSTPLT